jgi:hypothetical protein
VATEAIETCGSDGQCLRVEFVRRGDRLGHVICAVSATGEVVPLLESIEGSAADDWPKSPPLQSLSLETLPDGRKVALLVGMAGGSHWSASVEPALDSAELIFDIACRHAKQPRWLGSQYQQLPDRARRVVIDGEVAVTREQEIVSVQLTSQVASTGTARWRYIVRLASTQYQVRYPSDKTARPQPSEP